MRRCKVQAGFLTQEEEKEEGKKTRPQMHFRKMGTSHALNVNMMPRGKKKHNPTQLGTIQIMRPAKWDNALHRFSITPPPPQSTTA